MNYKSLLKTISEIENSESITEKQAKVLYEIFILSDLLLINTFEPYPDITHKQLYEFILNAPIESVLDMCDYIVKEKEFIENNLPKENGKIYLPFVTIKEEECNIVEKRGAKWDPDELMYYYDNYEESYKFSAWLSIELE